WRWPGRWSKLTAAAWSSARRGPPGSRSTCGYRGPRTWPETPARAPAWCADQTASTRVGRHRNLAAHVLVGEDVPAESPPPKRHRQQRSDHVGAGEVRGLLGEQADDRYSQVQHVSRDP